MIVGIDSSMTALGLCAVPNDFTLDDWSRVRSRTIVTKPGTHDIIRFEHLAHCVVSFCSAVEAEEIFLEDALVYRGNTKRLCKLSAIIEHELYRNLAILPRLVNVSSARKLMLGSVPQKDLAKQVVEKSLASLGAHFEDDAQADAFCVANFGRSEMGLWCVCAA